MPKKPKPLPPTPEPFEDVHLAGEMTLTALTADVASIRISHPGSQRAYSVNLPIFALRAWVENVDAAVTNGAGESRPRPTRPDPMMRETRA